MKFSIYQESRQGRRNNNEDRIAYSYSRESLLMLVADGMGGHYYGEIAAQIAVQSISDAFQREARPKIADPFMFLKTSMINAHRAILDFSNERHLNDSPRTTCVACMVQDNIAYWAHAGDSRLYLLREGGVLAQTRDHSRVRLLVDQGIISAASASTHPDRNKVYSCLGGPHIPEIDFSRKMPLEHGDILLLCTDGLWDGFSGERLAGTLRDADFEKTVPILLDQAESHGGLYCDNLSIVVARWEDSYQEKESESDLSSSISTLSMKPGEVTTRLDEFGRSPDYKVELSDDEIERAIEEIRSTIEKYSIPGK
ncbi:MAG: protein phosphatase 2C domain-containing protein [Betaproteobacteria bacterium]|nr:protein phosphatase 2C domain-containing protein [Betaproteobacteria bacterium]